MRNNVISKMPEITSSISILAEINRLNQETLVYESAACPEVMQMR